MSTQPKADINFQTDLFDAANQLRGPVSPADYKHYVLPLIFMRYLSLRYDKRKAQIEAMTDNPDSDFYAAGDEIIRETFLSMDDLYRSENVFIIPEKAHWDYIRANANQPNIKEIIDNAMKLIEETNPELQGTLPRIFQRATSLPIENVAQLITIFSRDAFSTSNENSVDILGRVYEYFIGNFASTEGQRGGEFFTPASIVKLLVAMLDPKEGKVFDPACGSGGMFIQSDDYSQHNRNLSFYGQEIKENNVRLGKMNVLLHGINADIRLGDSLLNDQFPDLKADYIIANPPFNMKDWGADRISNDDPRFNVLELEGVKVTDSNANFAWMQHFLYHLSDIGTAGFVIANGTMTTNVTGEKEVRQALIEQGYIDCIVQLPEKLFFTTNIPCCLFFLSKNRDGKNGDRKRNNNILFIDARQMGQFVSRSQKVLREEEIIQISKIYHNYRNNEGNYSDMTGICRIVTLEEVSTKGFKLTPGIYVGSETEEKDDIPFEDHMSELFSQLKEQFEESTILQSKILKDLEDLL
ncbi:type I restriction-modification system subunit M [Bacillus toyonensis]|uniref:site-specific DNA-methyltransferase (adenine-specific) n=1 Tax=Bacillus toyonensis TaxID=155322 RepID=A0A2C4PGJ0_9BACI|nr:class I SAM-dependent DNA methyltransferase [Bacillus toyonensis]PGA98732.1 DNA methyltransferase [Bacillus toyonensis]PHD64155.1 DNA methyltransferase [Bacillus toyonensis]